MKRVELINEKFSYRPVEKKMSSCFRTEKPFMPWKRKTGQGVLCRFDGPIASVAETCSHTLFSQPVWGPSPRSGQELTSRICPFVRERAVSSDT